VFLRIQFYAHEYFVIMSLFCNLFIAQLSYFSTCFSPYCLTEFNMAYHHNVAVKRKKRLIVLMMLDNPTDLYTNDASDTATLRQFVRQYTYIDYTADDWLDKLLYALPVRGLLQQNEDRNDDDAQLLENIQQNDDRNDNDVRLLDNIQMQ